MYELQVKPPMTAHRLEPPFWDLNGYKTNVKRMRDGADHLDEYAKMIKERMEIEQKYGKSLQSWQQKWLGFAEQNLNKSVIKDAWTHVMDEAKELAKAHLSVRERCNDELLKTNNLFRKENYHTSTIRGFKEAKEIEEEFEKVRKHKKFFFGFNSDI